MEKEKVIHFYQCLPSFVKLVPNQNFLNIDGDMIVLFGFSDVYKFAYRVSSNRNGLFLENFIQGNNLLYSILIHQYKTNTYGIN